MIIASIKYGNRRIGQYGINNYTCIADAEAKLKEYLGDLYKYRRFLYGKAENVTKQKNYVQDDRFTIVN